MLQSRKEQKTKDGQPKPESVVPDRKRAVTVRTECPARMKIKRVGAWYVMDNFVEEHNHTVLRKFDLSRFLRAHQFMDKEERDFVRVLHECNLETSRMMQIMESLHDSLWMYHTQQKTWQINGQHSGTSSR